MEKATFGAGCFWGSEEVFRAVPGVLQTQVGFMGEDEQPQAEVVEMTFDPAIVSYLDLLEVFWGAHDPTQLNRQGDDIGAEYRSVIYVHDEDQRNLAERSRASLAANSSLARPVVTQVLNASEFHRAAEFHQRYFEKRRKTVGT